MAEKKSPYDEFSGLTFIEELLREGDEDLGHSWRSSGGSPFTRTDIGHDDGSPEGGGDKMSGVSDGAPIWQAGSQGCSCGDPRDRSLTDTLQDEGSQISVVTGGKFPCLHIAVSGLLQDRRYLLALDFCEKFTDINQRFLTFTDPYYMPRPNHLEGRQWMNRVLYFNLTSIANGGLQKSGGMPSDLPSYAYGQQKAPGVYNDCVLLHMTLTSNCEYLPTLRIMGSGHGEALSNSPAVRFALKKSELLAVSLKSEVPNNMGTSAREFLLVRRYVLKSGTFSKDDLVPTSGSQGNHRPNLAQGQPRLQPAGVRLRFPRTENSLRPSQDTGLTKGVPGLTSNAHPVVDPAVRFPSIRRPPQNSLSGATYTPLFCVRPEMAAPLRCPVCPQQMHETARPGGQSEQPFRRNGMSSRCKRNFPRDRVPTRTALAFPSECLPPGPPSVPLCRARLASPLWVNYDLAPSSHSAFVGLY